MARPLIHLQRLADAYALNARSPIAERTIRDGALRPTTTTQRRVMTDLVRFASKETQEKQKQLHQMKIKAEASSILHALAKSGEKCEIDWEKGVFKLGGAKVTNATTEIDTLTNDIFDKFYG